MKGWQLKPKEGQLRLECYCTRYKEQQPMQPQLPLFQRCSIQSQDAKFHANMAALDMQLVQRDFLALFHPKPDGCLCCSSDKHAPKLYSSANNMIPGSVAVCQGSPSTQPNTSMLSGEYMWQHNISPIFWWDMYWLPHYKPLSFTLITPLQTYIAHLQFTEAQ